MRLRRVVGDGASGELLGIRDLRCRLTRDLPLDVVGCMVELAEDELGDVERDPEIGWTRCISVRLSRIALITEERRRGDVLDGRPWAR